jgi:hypothetical protein
MIRKQVGGEFWLIKQDDHARLAAQLAGHVGGRAYDAPAPSAVRGIALHDCGWPVHDDVEPTLSPQGLPLDVFETPRHIAMRVWSESSRRAAEEPDAYAALLVSLHTLSLSAYATTPSTTVAHEKFDMSDATNRFEVNKFQQQQIELQETLRRTLGMRIDEPRRFGLAEQSDDPRERQLIFDFRLLQAMDKLSLSVCCTKPPFQTLEPLLTRPAGANRPIKVAQTGGFELALSPWPFRDERVSASVPFKRVPGRPFESEQSFLELYRAAPLERFDFALRPA